MLAGAGELVGRVENEYARVEAALGAWAGEADVAVKQANVLVVDDDSVNRLLLARSLEQEGHRPTMAEDGNRALELLHVDSFDVVLLDVLMPGVDGFEVLAHMQADGELRRIPVIMISALEDIRNIRPGIELGAEDYLPKPFDAALSAGTDQRLSGEEATRRPGAQAGA